MSQCSDEEIQQLIAAMQADAPGKLAMADSLIAAYPDDARLHFLRGSLLAGAGRPIEAHASLSRAVALAPEFALARFQLGFFELTSGETARALATWEPLDDLSQNHYLALFVTGLRHLIADRFAEAVTTLREGIAVNEENPSLNRDMQMIIDRCADIAPPSSPEASGAHEASATSFLLGQLGAGSTRH